MPIDTTKRPTIGSSNGKLSKRRKPRVRNGLVAQERLRRAMGFASGPQAKADVSGIRTAANLSQEEFARLSGYSTRALAGWEAGKPLAQPARRRLAEIGRLLKALSELMPPGRVGQWLREPKEAFEGQTPMQVVERGEADRLWAMIHQIDANVAN